jgi:hypothetical protein
MDEHQRTVPLGEALPTRACRQGTSIVVLAVACQVWAPRRPSRGTPSAPHTVMSDAGQNAAMWAWKLVPAS